MEEHNLQAQAGRGNTQDNSKDKTIWNIHLGGLSELVVLIVALLAVLGFVVLLIWQPWTAALATGASGQSPIIPPPTPPKPQLLITLPKAEFHDGDLLDGQVAATREGYLYIVSLGGSGKPYVIFPHTKHQSAKVLAQEVVSLRMDLENRQTGEQVPLRLSLPPEHAGEKMRERLLFFLLDHELPNIVPGSIDADPQRSALLQAKLLELDFLDRVVGGDELSHAAPARCEGVLAQEERSYVLRRKVTNPPTDDSSPTKALPPVKAAELLKVETGLWKKGTGFTPTASFTPGDLLSVRLRVSAPCYARVSYESIEGESLILYPDDHQPDVLLPMNEDIIIPDPRRVHEGGEHSVTLELTNDSRRLIVERVFVQISDAPFDFAGSTQAVGTGFRSFGQLKLEQLWTRGVRKHYGANASSSQRAQDAAIPPVDAGQGRLLSISISPP
jgi:hypothetical protein